MEKIPTKERESGISRVVGIEEYSEDDFLNYFKRKFEQEFRDPIEQEHTPELEELIARINEKMKEFMALYGVESLVIPGRNIHIVDEAKLSEEKIEKFKKMLEKTTGGYLFKQQTIWILGAYLSGNKLHFAQILVHEMVHFNAFASMQKVKSGGIELTRGNETVNLESRRIGFEVDSPKAGKIFFHDINEAITTELTMRFDQSYFSDFDSLRQEYEERREAIQAFAKRSGKKQEEAEWLISNLEHQNTDSGHVVFLKSYAYREQREKLWQLINELYEKNKNRFGSAEEVFMLFAKAALNGRLLPIARLIEATYGKGSFRVLGKKTAKQVTYKS